MSRRRESAFPYVWVWRKFLPERNGQRCRKLLAPDEGPFPRKVTIEFEDGHQVHDVSVVAVRRAA